MNRRFAIYRLGIWTAICIFAIASCAIAAAWTDFTTAQFTGITLDKPLQVNVLDYTLSVSPNPTITLGSKTYKVIWVQSVYAVGGTPSATFTATNASNTAGWTWDSKASKDGQISGWTGQGNDRIDPGQFRTFHFAAFDSQRVPVVAGFHIGYDDGKDTITGWWKQNLATVPEPSGLICLWVSLVGMISLYARRFRGRRSLR